MKTVTCNQCHTVIYKSRMNELPPASILCPECHTMHKDKPEMTKFRKMLNGVEFIIVSGGFIAVMKISQSLDLLGSIIIFSSFIGLELALYMGIRIRLLPKNIVMDSVEESKSDK